jgi:hypothetical protein
MSHRHYCDFAGHDWQCWLGHSFWKRDAGGVWELPVPTLTIRRLISVGYF